jgi:transaldolase
MTASVERLGIKLFADGADFAGMLEMNSKKYIKGLTTNPTLMRKAGISDYKEFSLKVLGAVRDKPISLEVFSDDLKEMQRQGLEIASWANNVYVKVPITNTKGESTAKVIDFLVSNEVKVNITAVMSLKQVQAIVKHLNPEIPSYVSVFAGRIADTGVDPIPVIRGALKILSSNKNAELIWASPRELLNVFQASEVGCHIITATSDILNKVPLIGMDLDAYSLDTVKMFYRDALDSGYSL